MMLTGMTGLTPNVKRAIRRVAASGVRVTSHSVDDAPRGSRAVRRCVEPVAADVIRLPDAPVVTKVPGRSGRAPVLIEAAMQVVRAQPTLGETELARLAGCSVGTVRDARRRLRNAGEPIARYVAPSPKKDLLIAAIRDNPTGSLADFAAATGMTIETTSAYLTRLRKAQVVRKALVVVTR